MTAPENGLLLESAVDEDRRKFLASCGKFAVVTSPAITVLLSTSLNSTAIARSGGRPGQGWGGRDHGHHHHHHHHDGRRKRDDD